MVGWSVVVVVVAGSRSVGRDGTGRGEAGRGRMGAGWIDLYF